MRLAWIVVSLSLLLSACTRQPPETQAMSQWRAHQQQLENLEQWQARGKVAIIESTRRQSANLSWQQDFDRLSMQLLGPLGSEALSLDYQPGELTIVAGDKKYSGSNDPQQQLLEMSGWSVPLSQLPRWLIGLPDTQQYLLNEQNRVAEFVSQEQWLIRYSSYMQVDSYILPRQISVTTPTAELKIQINQWQINE